ncbi:MAG: NADH-quinone oxidoreductase subunit C [Deltaproteobacteria bacterium]|nr:NADH-quinone oxidoreductase subunit C [Deltaproteobacteria bacterium]
MSISLLNSISSRFGSAIRSVHSDRGDHTAVVDRTRLKDVCLFLRDDAGAAMDQPIDLTAVDYRTFEGARPQEERFAVVIHLRSLKHGHRLRLRVPVPENDPVVPSTTAVWKGLVWFEREVFDMFGIRFDGHPDLRRLLLYPEFVGHPLRKDYPLRGYQPTIPMPTLPRGDRVPGDSTEE